MTLASKLCKREYDKIQDIQYIMKHFVTYISRHMIRLYYNFKRRLRRVNCVECKVGQTPEMTGFFRFNKLKLKS